MKFYVSYVERAFDFNSYYQRSKVISTFVACRQEGWLTTYFTSDKSKKTFLWRRNFQTLPCIRGKHRTVGPFMAAICNSKRKSKISRCTLVHADWHMPVAFRNLTSITYNWINRCILTRSELGVIMSQL